MRRSPWIAAMLACLGATVHAGGVDWSMKPKAIHAAAVGSATAEAPFAAAREAPRIPAPAPSVGAFAPPPRVEAFAPRTSCERPAQGPCYDLADRRIVFRGARDYMPRLGELRPESVSLRSHRVQFRYSF